MQTIPGFGRVLFLWRRPSGNDDPQSWYAQCLASKFDGILSNAERIGAMQPVFAPRVTQFSHGGLRALNVSFCRSAAERELAYPTPAQSRIGVRTRRFDARWV